MTDLFAVGVALDLTGAYLLARGLLVSAGAIAQRDGLVPGGNPHLTVGAVVDRVDARFGLLTLLAGFTLQIAGYVVDLSPLHRRPRSPPFERLSRSC